MLENSATHRTVECAFCEFASKLPLVQALSVHPVLTLGAHHHAFFDQFKAQRALNGFGNFLMSEGLCTAPKAH